MFRLAYRNLTSHESMVVNHSIKASGTGKAPSAVRWYKVRSPGSSPVIFQSGTVGGGTSNASLWMGSIAMDKNGDIALGYSTSSTTLDPSIKYVGRFVDGCAGQNGESGHDRDRNWSSEE
jgi:hypothetical protein